MEVCYWALLFMPLVILHHLLNVFVQLANKRGFTKKKKNVLVVPSVFTTVLELMHAEELVFPSWPLALLEH
jgi:hypothetical protein